MVSLIRRIIARARVSRTSASITRSQASLLCPYPVGKAFCNDEVPAEEIIQGPEQFVVAAIEE